MDCRARVATLAAVVLAATLVRAEPTAPASFTGEAFDREGRLRYREAHRFEPTPARGHRSVTTYTDGSGRLIGRMEADYTASPFAPDYRLVNHRENLEQRVRREGAAIHVWQRIGDRETSRVLRATSGRPLVVGPGFNEFIRANWDALLGGRAFVCDFVIPSRMQVVAFRVSHDPTRSTAATARFRVTVDNRLLRLIAPELAVEYARATRRLLTYEGPSHIGEPERGAGEVVVRFPAPGVGDGDAVSTASAP